MDDFERMLGQSLRREEVPFGFEQRVMALTTRRRRVAWQKWTAIAAMAVLTAGAGWRYEEVRRERMAGESAKAQLETALRITSTKLHKVHQTIDALNEGF